MPKKLKIHNFIKHHPEIFETNADTVSHVIDNTEIPDIEWFYKRNRALLSQDGKATVTKTQWYRTKQFLMSASAVMILIVFLAGTPTGRAMAMTIYNTVFGYENGTINIHHSANQAIHEEVKVEKKNFRSFEDVEAEYGVTAVKSDMGKLVIIEAEKTEFQLIIHSTYSVFEDKTIKLTQTICHSDNNSDLTMDISQSGMKTIITNSQDGIAITGYVNDETGYAFAFLDRTYIDVYSDDIAYDEFLSFVESLTFM